MERARNETRKQYRILKELNLAKKRNYTTQNVKRSDGIIITGQLKRMNQWKKLQGSVK